MSDIVERLRELERFAPPNTTAAIRQALVSAADEITRLRDRIAHLERDREILAHEREAARAGNESLARRLGRIISLAGPDRITLPDGRVMQFVPPNPAEAYTLLSDAVRGIALSDDAVRKGEG